MPHPTLAAALSGLGSGITASTAAGAHALARDTSNTSFAQELQQARAPAAPPPAPPPPARPDKAVNRRAERPPERQAERSPERPRETPPGEDSETSADAADTRSEAGRRRSLRLWHDRWAERSERLGKAERAGARATLAGAAGDEAAAQDGGLLPTTGRTSARAAADAAAPDPLAQPVHLADATAAPAGKAVADALTPDPSTNGGQATDGGLGSAPGPGMGGLARQAVEPPIGDLQAAGDPALAGATADLHDSAADALALEGFVAAQGADLGTPVASPTATAPAFASELLRAHAALGTTAAGHGAPAELRLATPVPSPGFVPRFSSELAVLARDGVQEARIQVNPLELGPIAVQITLEGSAAQVHLAVDNAQTRELLEQAMPSLAAALRENGLTLTGGGVFQQARQQGRDDAGGGTGNSLAGGQDKGQAGSDDGGKAPAATRRSVHAGAVDLYA